MTMQDALKWIAARAEYARDYAGDENRKDIVAEIARVAIEALKQEAARKCSKTPAGVIGKARGKG